MTQTVAQQLHVTRLALDAVAGELAPLEARLLAAHAWGMSHEELVRGWDTFVAEDAARRLREVTARRVQSEPLAQIMGAKDFWKDNFFVSRDVLTPRADSETMIEALLRHMPDVNEPYSILDLGTGSGCLILSALREYPAANSVGVDRSPAALSVAKQNAMRLGLAARVRFTEGSWCKPLDSAEKFAIVLSNPPYIASAEIPTLDEDVKGFEPHLALDGGLDGLDCYREIFTSIAGHLILGACIVMEVGATQAATVAKLGEASGLTHTETCRDLAGIERVVVFRN